MSVRTFGGAVGTTIYTSIFQNKVAAILPGEVAKYAIQAGLPPSSAPAFVEAFLTPGANVTAVPHVTPHILAQAALGSAWGAARAFKYVWATSVAFGAVSCIVCLFVPNTRKYMTNRIAVVSAAEPDTLRISRVILTCPGHYWAEGHCQGWTCDRKGRVCMNTAVIRMRAVVCQTGRCAFHNEREGPWTAFFGHANSQRAFETSEKSCRPSFITCVPCK